MPVVDGVIQAPVDASDPYYAMGVGQYNGEFDITYICNHDRINWFNKYKPVDNPDDMEIVQGNNYRGEGDDCNISIELGINNIVYTARQTWKYRKVIDKESNWSRLLDFERYNHNAKYINADSPIMFYTPAETNNRNAFIMRFNVIAYDQGSLLGLKTIFDNRQHNLWNDYALGVFIVNQDNNENITVTTPTLASLNNYAEVSETEIRVQHPINFPTVFTERGNVLKIYPFISTLVSTEPLLNRTPLPNKVYSVRALSSYPEFYNTTVVKVPVVTLYTTTLYLTLDTNGNYYDIYIDVELSITDAFQQGGTLNYKLVINGNRIATPSLPLTVDNLTISIPSGSPIGTKVKKRAYNIYGNVIEGELEASINVECINNRDQKTEDQKRVEWYL